MTKRLLIATFCLLLSPALTSAAAIEILALDEVQPGMIGEGRTVFSGEEIETFQVKIMGVLKNFGPNQNMILAELEGGPLAHTGVIAGMSGSPVFIDEKLVGAVAYAFPFAKDPIAGITPIQEMIDATATPVARRAAKRLEFPLSSDQLAWIVAEGPRPVAIQGASLRGIDRLQPYLGRMLTPIATPAALHGFPMESFELLAPLFRQLGIEPVMGGAAAPSVQTSRPEPAPNSSRSGEPSLRPGDAVGVALVTGDLEIAATGTLTYADPLTGNVYAFGHPLFNLGPIGYPMTRATVHLILPSLMNSVKMASSGETIGTWVQDRSTAIKGVLDARPRMIPLEVSVKTSRGQEKTYSLELVDDELFSPVLAFASLVAILQSTERQFGSQTVKLSAWVTTDDNRRIAVEDVFTDQQASVSASAMVAAPISFLLANDFQDVHLENIRVEVEASEITRNARLVRAWLDTDEVAPGGTAELKLLLQSYRGEEMMESIPINVPPDIREGEIRLLVADAGTVASLERRESREPFVPKDMDQLVRAINALRKNNRLYVRLSRGDRQGAIVSGEYLTALPPSVMGILQTDDSSSGFTRLANSTFWEHEVVTDYNVTGSRMLTIRVRNP